MHVNAVPAVDVINLNNDMPAFRRRATYIPAFEPLSGATDGDIVAGVPPMS